MHKHVQALVDAGLVEPMQGKRRGVRLSRRAVDHSSPKRARAAHVTPPGRQSAAGLIPRGTGETAIRGAAPGTVPAATHDSAHPGLALPWLGHIAAGRPIEAIEASETIEVPPALMPRSYPPGSDTLERDYYVLRVRGDSMCEDGILDGDWIVVEHRETARNGEMVVALVDEAEATLKRIEQRSDACVLHPCNASYAPMVFEPDRVRIQGVVVAQMRKYD